MATITVQRTLQEQQLMKEESDKMNEMKRTEFDVIICPMRELVRALDQEFGRRKFRCYSWVLAANSPKFNKILFGRDENSRKAEAKAIGMRCRSRVQIGTIIVPMIYDFNMHQNIMKTILDYIHLGKCKFRRYDAKDVIEAAERLEMYDLHQKCMEAFCDDIPVNPVSIFDYCRIEMHDTSQLFRACKSAMRTHQTEILDSQELDQVTMDTFMNVLRVAVHALMPASQLKSFILDWNFYACRRVTLNKVGLSKDYNIVNNPDLFARIGRFQERTAKTIHMFLALYLYYLLNKEKQ